MQDLDQNMDDLFRKAAADYPLKLNKDQWDDIAPLVTRGTLQGTVSPKKNSRKYKGLLVLFLSLFLSAGLIIRNSKPTGPYKAISSRFEAQKANPAILPDAIGSINNKTIEKKTGQSNSVGQPALLSRDAHSLVRIGKERVQQQQSENDSFKTYGDASSENTSRPSNLPANCSTSADNIVAHGKAEESIPELNKNGPPIDSISHQENREKIKSTGVKKLGRETKGVYLGAVAGPLLDEVKNQGLKKTGFSAGLIAGYRFKNHFSIETGLLYAQKPYFSTGKYFKMDKIGSSMPTGMEILSLEGNSRLLEIPVKIKYDFLNRQKSNFFLSAGITSYAMTHEKNNYLVFMNGTQQGMISSYKNKSKSLAASFDISAGYEHVLGKSSHIRIEPYLQIPLGGIGVGSMPMRSSGLRIGITKPIH